MACCIAFAVVFGGLISSWRKLRLRGELVTGFAPVARRTVFDKRLPVGTLPADPPCYPIVAELPARGGHAIRMAAWLVLLAALMAYVVPPDSRNVIPVAMPDLTAATPGSAAWCSVICSSLCPQNRNNTTQ